MAGMKDIRTLGRALMCAGAVAWSAEAQTQSAQVRLDSRSGQFTIYGPQGGGQEEPANSEYVNLTAASLALSCARIRRIFLTELKASDRWGHKIFVVINPRLARDADIVVAANQFLDGWHYRVQVPSVIAKEKLTRCVVRTLLQEMANRSSRGSPAPVPLWLTEGMSRHIQVTSKAPLYPPVKARSALRIVRSGNAAPSGEPAEVAVHLVENPDAPTFVFDSQRHQDPLAQVKEQLRNFEPLTFLQMDQAEDARLSIEEWSLFRDCAHLAVARLLAMPGGRDCLRRMLELSPNYLNWQFAFLEGFERHFTTPLDIEKWWSLQIVSLNQPDLQQRLSDIDALDRLDAMLDLPLRFRTSGEGGEQPEEVPLQVMIDLVDYPEQREALVEIIMRLRRLHWQVSPDLIKLVDDYMVELDGYVVSRDKIRSSGGNGRARVTGNAAAIVRRTLDRLKFLDVIRADMRVMETELAKSTDGP